MKTRHAIILAAGEGKRLLPFTEHFPKCFAEVGGVTILENALQQFGTYGIESVSIVAGHLKEVIIQKIGNTYHDIKISYIHNDDYKTTNSMYSLYLALQGVKEPTWVLEGDVFFSGDILHLPAKDNFSWFADSSIRNLDGAYLRAGEDRRIVSLEIIRNLSLLEESHHKSMGLLHLNAAGASQLEEWLAKGVQEGKINLYYDLIVAEHLQDFYLNLVDVKGQKWFEIDTNEDLILAGKVFE
jgi:L-glutamine-phosphate cytidylyltransferase